MSAAGAENGERVIGANGTAPTGGTHREPVDSARATGRPAGANGPGDRPVTAGDEGGRAWWRDAVCYEVHPRAFADGNGDGTGDLRGLTARLDHLTGLGVDAVWVTPCYPSPLADGGYDISDHRAVAGDLGTLDDFDAFVARAHELGLKVVIDVVPNHTSDRHPWFRAGLKDRYHFLPGRDGGESPPSDWQSAFGGPAWTRTADGDWYLHLHAPEQPDLNWEHPAVRADFAETLRFWLERGVDGFRVDVAHTLFKEPGYPDAGPGQHADPYLAHHFPYYDREALHPLFREWRALVDSHPHPAERLLVAESGVLDPERLARYVRPGEMQQAFNFAFLEAPWDGPELRRVIDASTAVTDPVTWVLSSHDAVRPATRYGSAERARAMALLMLALPGAVYLYQGEELGLPQAEIPDDRIVDPVWERSGHTERGRDGARVPLPWSGARPPYGFTTAPADRTWLPQPDDWAGLTVAAQHGDPDSTLALYRTALRLRRAHPADAASMKWLSGTDDTLLAFVRGELACAVNLGDRPRPPGLPGRAVLASSRAAERQLSAGGLLPPGAAVWFSTAA